MKRFAGRTRTKPLSVSFCTQVFPPAAVTADTPPDRLNYLHTDKVTPPRETLSLLKCRTEWAVYVSRVLCFMSLEDKEPIALSNKLESSFSIIFLILIFLKIDAIIPLSTWRSLSLSYPLVSSLIRVWRGSGA